MNFKKIIAVIAVFVMVAVPVTVMAESNEAAGVEKVKLSELESSHSTEYWLTVPASTANAGGTDLHVEYNSQGKDCIIDCDGEYYVHFNVGTTGVFKIPSKSSLIVSNTGDVAFVLESGKLEVCGSFNTKHYYGTSNLSLCKLYMGEGAVLMVNGGIISLNPVVDNNDEFWDNYCLIYLEGITSPVSSNGCLTITSIFGDGTSTYDTFKISGIAEGITSSSIITSQYGDSASMSTFHYIFDGFKPSNTEP